MRHLEFASGPPDAGKVGAAELATKGEEVNPEVSITGPPDDQKSGQEIMAGKPGESSVSEFEADERVGRKYSGAAVAMKVCIGAAEKQQPAATVSMGSPVVERVLEMADVILTEAPDVPKDREVTSDVAFPGDGVVDRRCEARGDHVHGEITASVRAVELNEVPFKGRQFITEAGKGCVPSCEKHMTAVLHCSADVGVPLATAALRKADEDDKRVPIEVLAQGSMTLTGRTCRAGLAVPIVAVTQCALGSKGSTKMWKRPSREENVFPERTICLRARHPGCGFHPFDPGG